MAPELHAVSAEDVGWFTERAGSAGWSVAVEPALPTGAGGSMGGVAVCARRRFARLYEAVAPVAGRSVVVSAVMGDNTHVSLASVYCVTGKGLGVESLELLAAVAAELERRRSSFLVGGVTSRWKGKNWKGRGWRWAWEDILSRRTRRSASASRAQLGPEQAASTTS